MIIETSRFGKVEIQEDDLIHFAEGLLGFADLRQFVLLDDPTDEIFAWLQSCESAQVAFPILSPGLFKEDYNVTLPKSDLAALNIEKPEKMRFFTIVTIPDDPTQMTANLKAPVVINIKTRQARQCVLQDNNLAIREPIFAKLQQRVVQNPGISIKHEGPGIDVAVRIPDPTYIREHEA